MNAELHQAQPSRAGRRGPLARTGKALVTIRNEAGGTYVFRLRGSRHRAVDGTWVTASSIWVDVATDTGDWIPVGMYGAHLFPSPYVQSDPALVFACGVALEAARDGRAVAQVNGRRYTVLVEDRCGRCGGALPDASPEPVCPSCSP